MTQPQWQPQQPLQPQPQFQSLPPPPAPKPKRFGWPTVIIVAVGSWIIGILMGALGGTGTTTGPVMTSASPSVSQQASNTGTEAASQPTASARHTPDASDFSVSLKIIDKQCFGSAGCNMDYRPKITAEDLSALPSSGTAEVSYKITGGSDGPILGTFVITFSEDTPQVEGQDEGFTDTANAGATLKIKITSVDYTE